MESGLLFSEDFLHVADFLLDFAGDLFVGAAISQVGVADRFAALLFHFSFGFTDIAFDLVFGARFHHYGIATRSGSGRTFRQVAERTLCTHLTNYALTCERDRVRPTVRE